MENKLLLKKNFNYNNLVSEFFKTRSELSINFSRENAWVGSKEIVKSEFFDGYFDDVYRLRSCIVVKSDDTSQLLFFFLFYSKPNKSIFSPNFINFEIHLQWKVVQAKILIFKITIPILYCFLIIFCFDHDEWQNMAEVENELLENPFT